MAGNPLLDLGVLNRILGSVTWTNFPALNVTAPYLDKDGINLRLDGEASQNLPAMTGTVQSPEPYIQVEVVISLLKTLPLSGAYKAQWEDYPVIGPGTVYPDVSSGLPSFQVYNMAISRVGDLLFNGTTAMYGVSCRGYYVVSNALFA